MKSVLSTVLAASVISIGLIGVSTTGALAQRPAHAGGGRSSNETETNIFCTALDFSHISTYTGCERFTGNDSNQLSDVASLFEDGANINNNWNLNDAYKIDIDEEYSGSGVATEFYRLTLTEENAGTVEFLEDINYEFALVFKTSTNWSAYEFNGIAEGTILDINTLGVSTNNGQGRAFSHVSLYVSDTYREVISPQPRRVPEPGSIVSLSLIGVALAGIRKKSEQ